MKQFFTLFAFFALVFSASALETTHQKGDYITPHIKWETPAKSPKKKILFFTKSKESIGRYPAELAQRYNLDYELVYWNKSNTYGWVTDGQVCIGKEEGLLRAEELIRKGGWDCFVFWGSSPTTLLRNSKSAYLSLVGQIVRNGTGIVYVDTPARDEKILKKKNRIAENPCSNLFRNGLTFEFYSIGKGLGSAIGNFDTPEEKRTYLRKPNVTLNYCEGWRTQYEMRLSDVYLAIRWTMKQPLSHALNLKGNKLGIVPSFSGKTDLFIQGEGDSYQLLQGGVLEKGKQFTVELPRLVPGKYLIGMIIKENGKVVEFCSLPYTAAKKKEQSVDGVRLSAGGGKIGTKITGSASVRGTGEIYLRLRDASRRILKEQKLTTTGNTAAFEFVIEEYLPHLITVEIALLDGKNELDRAYSYCYKTLHRTGKSTLTVWGDATYAIASMDLFRRYEELGIEEAVNATGPQISPYEVLSIPPLFQPRIEHARKETECWLSKEKAEWINRVVSYQLQDYKDKGVDHVLFGDEGPVQLGCLCTSCKNEFQAYLKLKYKTLESLNKAWQSNFTAWKQTGLSMIPEKHDGADLAAYGKEMFGAPDTAFSIHAIGGWNFSRARDWNQLIDIIKKNPKDREFYGDQYLMQDGATFLAKNYTRWFDVCDFRSHVISKVFRHLDQAVKKAVPEASAGISGTAYVTRVSDFDRFTKALPWMIPYSHKKKGNPANELIASMTPSNYISGTWVGYAKDPKVSLEYLWEELLPTPGMIAIFAALSSPPVIYGVFKPDLALNDMGKGILDATRQFRNGVADTLMSSKKRDDGVLVLYSWPSNWAVHLKNGNSFGEPGEDHTGAFKLAESLGFKPQYLSMEKLENNPDAILNKKVILLPRTEVISDTQAAALKKFAENGGTVIADLRPGIFNEQLRIRKNKISDDCFGISRDSFAAKKSVPLKAFLSDHIFDLDPGVKTLNGKAMFTDEAGTPAIIVNNVGKGRFVLLNFPFNQMPSFTNRTFSNGSGRKIAELFPRTPPIALYSDTEGKRLYHITSYAWINGDMTLIYAQNSSITMPEKNFGVTFSEPAFILDATAKRQYDLTDKIRFKLAPPNPTLFVLSNKKLPPLKVSVPSTFKKGELARILCCSDGYMKGIRPAVLTMEHQGKPTEYFRHKLLLKDGKDTEIKFQTAWNEKPGIYTLLLEDVLTGKITKASFEVK